MESPFRLLFSPYCDRTLISVLSVFNRTLSYAYVQEPTTTIMMPMAPFNVIVVWKIHAPANDYTQTIPLLLPECSSSSRPRCCVRDCSCTESGGRS